MLPFKEYKLVRFLFKWVLIIGGTLLLEGIALDICFSAGMDNWATDSYPWWTPEGYFVALILALLPFFLIWRFRKRIF